MHTATQLEAGQFAVEIAGVPAALGDLLPGWTDRDRLGVVVREPFGALGASALVQAVVTAFYDHDPARRTVRAQYPEIYLVHAGGPWGDHSMLDFWPARKECVVEPEPAAVLAALNDRGVTRLLVPEGVPAALGAGAFPSAGFSELAAARDALVGCFAYAATGTVADGDVVVRASGAAAGENALAALEPEELVAEFAAYPTSGTDDQGWRDRVVARADEVDPGVRAGLAVAFRSSLADGVRTESYRRITVDEALGRLA